MLEVLATSQYKFYNKILKRCPFSFMIKSHTAKKPIHHQCWHQPHVFQPNSCQLYFRWSHFYGGKLILVCPSEWMIISPQQKIPIIYSFLLLYTSVAVETYKFKNIRAFSQNCCFHQLWTETEVMLQGTLVGKKGWVEAGWILIPPTISAKNLKQHTNLSFNPENLLA